ncbi:hypothetical protein A1O3_09546 [Capronia epimyces CBS 606.96]|uniref:Uncharacterized protein n=1 Tax=Capronia epimyces CBS 606.96 TaxID=1182542 RepID=W9XIZ2_9EURO|nr:uncharacterized protein A1O3_09546 [Capronia epimyces CBS 606.96]EXJ77320.1 hypothetical protein A1O3_09546 [Capronia epimyces CBS 606.96]
MGHAHDGIYQRHYQNDVVDVDIVAAVLEKPSDERSMRLLGHVSLTRDPNAPTSLTLAQRRQLSSKPEIRAAKEGWLQSTKAIRRDFVTLSKARKLAQETPELRTRLSEHDKLFRTYKKILTKDETDELQSLQAEYFQTLGSTCLENQYTGQEEADGPTPATFAFSERQGLARLLFPAPYETPSYDDQIQNSAQIVRLLCALCGRRDSQRPRRAKQKCDQLDSPPAQDPNPNDCFIDTCPEIFPIVFPGTQRLFCLGDDSLAPEIRTHCFKNSFLLTRHVQNQHLNHLAPSLAFVCPHPHCQVTRVECLDASHFKIHALNVHNIVHSP